MTTNETDEVKTPGLIRRLWHRPNARTAIVGVVAFIIGAGLGGADSEEALRRAAIAESKVASAQSRMERAEEAADNALQIARREVSRDLNDERRRLRERDAELNARAAAISTAEAIARRSTFGDGQWEVGVDIEPGKYKTSGSGACYWAKLRPDGDIIANNYAPGPQVVTIAAGIVFESKGCGQWQRAA